MSKQRIFWTVFLICGMSFVVSYGVTARRLKARAFPPAISHVTFSSLDTHGMEHDAITCDVYQFAPELVDNCRVVGDLDGGMQTVVDDIAQARRKQR